MDTINPSVVDNESTLGIYRWSSINPTLLSTDSDNSVNFCRPIKIEHPFEMDAEQSYRISSPSQLTSKNTTTSSATTIPLASCATAAASISSAFCRRSSGFIKSVSTYENSFLNLICCVLSQLKNQQVVLLFLICICILCCIAIFNYY